MRKILDIPYSNDSKTQKLDLYLPNVSEGPYPLILFIHGGGWQMGDKNDGQQNSWINLVNFGYALASMNYRMFPESVHPDGILDAKKALQFLEENKEKYNLDMSRVGVIGSSAGGHSALMLATTQNNPNFSTGKPDVPISCVIAWYAPTDFYNGKREVMSSIMNQIKHGLTINCTEKYFGKSFNSISDEELINASPVTYINEQMPPIIIQQGTKDFLNPPNQALLFLEAAKGKGLGHKVQIDMIEGAGHVDPVFDERENKIHLRRFLNKYLKNRIS